MMKQANPESGSGQEHLVDPVMNFIDQEVYALSIF